MKRKQVFFMCLSVTFLSPMVACSVALGQFFDGDSHRRAMRADPVGAVLVTYSEANREFRKLENPMPEETLSYRQEWRDRLEKVKAEHPQSEFVLYVRSELLQLYNDLNELDKSQAVVCELIDAAHNQEEKYLWSHELGTISQRKYEKTQDESDLQKSKEAFEQANELFLSFSPETQKQLKRALSPEGQDDEPPQIEDPIHKALIAYSEAADDVRKNSSPVSALDHMQEWRNRIEEAIAENPQSEFVAGARRQLLGLYNGLNEYDRSQALLRKMISEASMPEEKVFFQNQLGAISRKRYLSTQDPKHLQESRKAFEQANEIILSLLPEGQDENIGGMHIANLCALAIVAREENDHERAATLFRSVREMFQASAEGAMYMVSIGYGLEYIANQEMIQWIHVREEANALECLATLSNLTSCRWAPSYYAQRYATLWYGEWHGDNSAGFQDFVSKWLNGNAFDDRTPILMAYLGFSYYKDELYDEALLIYETLRDKHRDDFRRLEPKVFERGSGGYYEQVLHHLTQIYSQRGDMGKAESTKTELIALSPESPLVKFLYNRDDTKETWTLPERGRYLGFRIFLTVTSIVMILLGLYFAWRKNI